MPLDVDEFVVLEADQGFVADARRIRAAFLNAASSNEMRKFKFSSRVAACPAPADDGDALGGGLRVVASAETSSPTRLNGPRSCARVLADADGHGQDLL